MIVGEGAGDAAFLRHLCTIRNIDGFQVVEAGGTGKFEQFFKSLPGWTHIERLKGLVVCADSDDGPVEQFKSVRKALKAADLPTPRNPMEVEKRPNSFSVVVLMIPFTQAAGPQRGCLETLLLQSASVQNQTIYDCVVPFSSCVGANNWPTSHRDKMKMRAIIAAAIPSDPNYSLQYALKPDLNLIPLNHACFNEVADFLRGIQQKLV